MFFFLILYYLMCKYSSTHEISTLNNYTYIHSKNQHNETDIIIRYFPVRVGIRTLHLWITKSGNLTFNLIKYLLNNSNYKPVIVQQHLGTQL